MSRKSVMHFPYLLPFILIATLFPYDTIAQTSFPTHHSLDELYPSTSGAFRYGLFGYDNPALLSTMEHSELALSWSDGGGDWNSFQRWGLFGGFPNLPLLPKLGFGFIHDKQNGFSVTDYRLSVGFGNRDGGLGIGYGWSGGDDSVFNRHNHLTLGILSRPNPHLSIGLTGITAFSGGEREGIIELGLRPFGNEALTLYGDYTLNQDQKLTDGAWSVGTVAELLPGIRLTGRYFENKTLSLGMGLSLGTIGVGSHSSFNSDFDRQRTTYSVRSGGYDRNIFRTLFDKSRYLALSLRGGMKYQRYRLFDNTRTLRETLDAIDAAKEDPVIGGIAINTSGMRIRREMLWEIREKLEDFKRAGKRVTIYFDRADMDDYLLISVADHIVMDPLGSLELKGYAIGRTYYREMLDKLGIKFEEIRLYRYKSAYEDFARNEMSPGDREQRQRLVDALYELARDEISSEGRMDGDEFDGIVDSVVWLRGEEALDYGLVDALGRGKAVQKDLAKHGLGGGMGSGSLARYSLPNDDRWSEPPQIAILYAVGVCAMDEGINARSLSRQIGYMANDATVKGVILRVDSPGGDPLASDLVAEALKKCSEKKPVVISQGSIAASGGYWLSMYGDVIVAAPNTITGSIGVISGWMYDDGAFDSLGTSVEIIQRGRHADLGLGPTLPFLDISLPDRSLTEEELTKFKSNIRIIYEEFIERVAEGRNMSVKQVDSVGQGRVWMGIDAKELGLVDSLGGLDLAIAIAKERAGIGKGEEIRYLEYPTPGLLDLSRFIPNPFSTNVAVDPVLEELQFRIENNGQPMPIISIDYVEE